MPAGRFAHKRSGVQERWGFVLKHRVDRPVTKTLHGRLRRFLFKHPLYDAGLKRKTGFGHIVFVQELTNSAKYYVWVGIRGDTERLADYLFIFFQLQLQSGIEFGTGRVVGVQSKLSNFLAQTYRYFACQSNISTWQASRLLQLADALTEHWFSGPQSVA